MTISKYTLYTYSKTCSSPSWKDKNSSSVNGGCNDISLALILFILSAAINLPYFPINLRLKNRSKLNLLERRYKLPILSLCDICADLSITVILLQFLGYSLLPLQKHYFERVHDVYCPYPLRIQL